MGEILLSRYDLFMRHSEDVMLSLSKYVSEYHQAKFRTITHITTNLNAQELEKRYGNRVRSRLREMFNLISFESTSIDKRE